jgi:hypothetical protein
MRSKNSTHGIRRGETGATLEAVRVGKELIAFFPQEMHRPQPYVILLDPASGILKRLNLESANGHPL